MSQASDSNLFKRLCAWEFKQLSRRRSSAEMTIRNLLSFRFGQRILEYSRAQLFKVRLNQSWIDAKFDFSLITTVKPLLRGQPREIGK